MYEIAIFAAGFISGIVALVVFCACISSCVKQPDYSYPDKSVLGEGSSLVDGG